MYENFAVSYSPDTSDVPQPYEDRILATVEGFTELAALGAGLSFGRGIVRIHSESEMLRARRLVKEGFPEYDDRVIPFAKDWLGRQYAVLLASPLGPVRQLLLIEPGSGDAFEIDCGIAELFDAEMVADPVTYLAADLFAEWKPNNPDIPASGKCVGFKVPLFLGGSGSVDNLEVSDEEVYWSLFGQLRSQVKAARPPQ